MFKTNYTKPSQLETIRTILFTECKISRNTALNMYITRLSAIIYDLKKEGWEFKAFWVNYNTPYSWANKDYVYEVIKNPYEK